MEIILKQIMKKSQKKVLPKNLNLALGYDKNPYTIIIIYLSKTVI
jgi:hypothetical protein